MADPFLKSFKCVYGAAAAGQTVTAEQMGGGQMGIKCKNGPDTKEEVLHVSRDVFSLSSGLLLPCILWPHSPLKPSDCSCSS